MSRSTRRTRHASRRAAATTSTTPPVSSASSSPPPAPPSTSPSTSPSTPVPSAAAQNREHLAPHGGPSPVGYLTLARAEQPVTELEVRRSRFLAQAARAGTEEAARAFIARARSTFPDARHHCSAFIVAVEGARPVERSSDDGEPSGTAGGPMLEVLRGTGLVSTVVVVTRYFGGTLLGTGGLVRAYSEAAAQALAAATRVRLATRHLWTLTVPPAQAGHLEAGLRGSATAADVTVEETTWAATQVVLTLSTPDAQAASLRPLLASLSAGRARLHPAGTRLVEVPERPDHA
ncbi:YigZ family protein [Actinomyces wuliandei]|uniref:YigZ family protein n=1 Tax=Actinomyces wuliandei TaxID=2057743 RepID=UPI000FD7214C